MGFHRKLSSSFGAFGTSLLTRHGELLWSHDVKASRYAYGYGNLEWNKYGLLAVGGEFRVYIWIRMER